MTKKLPWMKFYPSDWRSDPRLRMCSLAARGLWIEIIALMHEAEPYGHLLVSGIAPTDAQLAVLTGTPSNQIPDLIGELDRAGVFSRTGKGVIYSRRMTRDEKKSRIARNNGKTGGNPKLGKQTINSSSDNQQDKGQDKTQKPEDRVQIEEKNTKKENPLSEDDPPKLTPRKVLEEVLDAERVAAVLEHRKKKKAPLTEHAAKLLVKELRECPDANAAADLMILRGWQSLKAEWVKKELPAERTRPGYMKHALAAQ